MTIRQWAAVLYKQVVEAKKANVVSDHTTGSDLETEKSLMRAGDNNTAVIKRTSQPISFDKYQMKNETIERTEIPPSIPRSCYANAIDSG